MQQREKVMKKKIILCFAALFFVLFLALLFYSMKMQENKADAFIEADKNNADKGSVLEGVLLWGGEWQSMASKEELYPGAEIVTLGSYEQDGDSSNGKEPIEWIVLDETEDSQLVISKYVLERYRWGEIPKYVSQYTGEIVYTYKPGIGVRWVKTFSKDGGSQITEEEYEIDDEPVYTWENSNIRKYLNGSFLNKAFTKEEQARIRTAEIETGDNPIYGTEGGNTTTDRIFLLSIEESEKYFNSENINTYMTPALIKKIFWPWSTSPMTNDILDSVKENGGRLYSRFVLRNLGEDIYNVSTAGKDYREDLTEVYDAEYINLVHPVRPAMWISKE